jgi:hypothetical protein
LINLQKSSAEQKIQLLDLSFWDPVKFLEEELERIINDEKITEKKRINQVNDICTKFYKDCLKRMYIKVEDKQTNVYETLKIIMGGKFQETSTSEIITKDMFEKMIKKWLDYIEKEIADLSKKFECDSGLVYAKLGERVKKSMVQLELKEKIQKIIQAYKNVLGGYDLDLHKDKKTEIIKALEEIKKKYESIKIGNYPNA